MKKAVPFYLAIIVIIGGVILSQILLSKRPTQQVSLVAVGDNLIHDDIYIDAKKNGIYNFDHLYRHITKDIQGADIAVINQETIFVDKSYSGYPTFGSPTAVGDAISKAGFNVVTYATNHTFDYGAEAIEKTIGLWEQKYPSVKVLGMHKSKEDAAKIQVIEKKGIKIAMLNYTYGINGEKIPAGKDYLVDCLGDESKIKADIKTAKEKSDIVIVFAHMGTENQNVPDAYQKKWAQFFADQGVGIMIGSHPHVVEPYKTIKGKNGGEMICYYSVGNFVSAQWALPNLIGGMANITIVKDENGTKVKNYDMIPLVTHYCQRNRSSEYRTDFTVYKLSDYTDELAKQNPVFSDNHYTVDKLKKLYQSMV